MQKKSRFFFRILFPSLVAVLLFMASIYLFVIPDYRESLMDGKRETISELTNTAWSVMHNLDMMVDENFTLNQAQSEAIMIIGDMRWGSELKDYFWIIDTTPRMVMHPYLPSMDGMDLSDYQDMAGKKLFVTMVDTVKVNGDGYVDYEWQWKDDTTTVAPKVSYVKAFEPWGWIVGTGIYTEDVNKEISKLTQRVVWISVFITIVIGALITYLARRNYITEQQRQEAQERLRDSMKRYKKLVEASTDGVLMIIDGEIVYCNPYLLNLLDYSQEDFDSHNDQFFETLSKFVQTNMLERTDQPKGESAEISTEQKIKKRNGVIIDVVVSRSEFDIDGKQGYIYGVKDVSRHKDVERELGLSMEKFKSIAGLMNLGVFRCSLDRQSRFIEINPKALALLGYSSLDELKDSHVQDLFDVKDERKEVVRAINEGIHIKDRLLRLKRADGSILPALVSLFPVKDTHGKTIYCDGIIIDAYNNLYRDGEFGRSESDLQLSSNVLLHPVTNFTQPAPACDMGTTVEAASRMLTASKADILLIKNDMSAIIGIITHSDISRRVISKGANLSIPISEIMSAPVISVPENDMAMNAFSSMVQHKVSYIVVKPDKGIASSYISLLHLSELRRDTPEYMINSIQKAVSAYDIKETMSRLPRLISTLVETGTGVNTTGKLISKITDTITEKLIDDAVNEIGQPPVPFVFLALGSEGRKEQTLATDQDNAIVYQKGNEGHKEEHKEYFLKLGTIVCNRLSEVGYPLCKGGVMAMNEEWCMNLEEWKKTVTHWIDIPNPQEVLNTSIFFDFRPVYGDFTLANDLQYHCLKMLRDKSIFFFNMAGSIVNLKPSGPDSNNSGDYNLKGPVLAITSITRLWALMYGISERNTVGRMLALQSVGILNTKAREELDQVLRHLMLMRIRNQLRQIEENGEPDNNITTKQFSDIDKLMLKRALSAISEHINRLVIEFRIS